MKASPNREQFLFLVTGGIILVLILLVVIFNMVRSPGDLITEKESQPPPKVKVGDRASDANKSAWLTQVAPAPIFNPDGQNKTEAKVEIDAKDLSAAPGNAKDDGKSRDPWGSKEASALESARLESNPLPKEVGLSTAKSPSQTLNDGHIVPPMPQMANTPGARPTPPPPPARGQALNDPKNASAQAKGNVREPVNENEGDDNAKSQKASGAPGSGFTVQVASFNDTEHAEALVAKLSSLMFEGKRMPTFIANPKSGAKTVYRVRLGPFQTQQRAQQAANMAQAKIGGVKAVVLNPGQ
ncbi:MAG: SPOR domain-containing protein [Magnetococcales bacterium]|nr:SPOR domain-containing protein [Magnetococcales bacterium]